jgi:hypothetical protein
MIIAETVASGLGLLEGPVWRDGTGDLLVTGVGSGFVLQVDVENGTAARFADTGGGPNGAYPSQDGGLLITQNGGLDWDAIGIPNPEPSQPTTPGIQRVTPDGTVRALTDSSDGPFGRPMTSAPAQTGRCGSPIPRSSLRPQSRLAGCGGGYPVSGPPSSQVDSAIATALASTAAPR